jgi:hypothetical protein
VAGGALFRTGLVAEGATGCPLVFLQVFNLCLKLQNHAAQLCNFGTIIRQSCAGEADYAAQNA